ncbi:hypothetical protein HPB50_009225 [Hyalomma asiaticum]|uniref:Uncharacterized protein n=1 Tax=Hyalomma asiaticum TaxID=266040 RepID=A0ACB7T940_HYAAI|nr:hypothetical protein HPB50_009225 [Hyalomma asiaticum]
MVVQEAKEERSSQVEVPSAEGLRVSNAQAAKILGNKKGKLVCKDTAQALWSSSVLAKRSVKGNVAPKKRALGELPKQQLTPEKVDVVAAIVRTNVELMDSDSEYEEFDGVVTVLALKLTKIQRSRIPRYLEEVSADAAPVFIHDRRQCRQDAAD